MLRTAENEKPGRPGGRTASSGLLVFGGTFVGNVLAYAFNVVLSRGLGPHGYAELGTLLSIFLVGSVAGLAVQAVSARRVAIAVDGPPEAMVELCRRLRTRGLIAGVVVVGTFLGLAPLVSAVLPSVSALGVMSTGTAIASATFLGVYLGLAQGASRFGIVAALFLAANAIRLAIGVVTAYAGASPSTVMATSAGAWVAAAVAGHFLLRDLTRTPAPQDADASAEIPPPRLEAVATAVKATGGYIAELLRACAGLGGIMLFANLDVLLASRYLVDGDLGRYNTAALLARAAYFGPQFITILVFPRLARPQERRRALAVALTATAVIGAAAVGVTAAIGSPLIKAAFGAKYATASGDGSSFDIGSHAWMFTAVGALLAVVQLALFDGVARRSHTVSVVVIAGILMEAVSVATFAHGSPTAIVTAAASCAAVTAVVSVGVCLLARPAMVPEAVDSETTDSETAVAAAGERQVSVLPQTSS